MVSYTFYIYSVSALSYNAQTGAFDLIAGYDHTQHRYRIDVTDDDATMNSSGDANQVATIYDMAGNVVNSGNIFVPRFATVQDPATGQSLFLDRIEVNGVHYGYVSSVPLTPGSSYPVQNTGTFEDSHAYYQANSVACLAAGTLIDTRLGPKAIELLVPGDVIIGYSGEELVLRKCLRRRLTALDLHARPRLRPIRIMAGALGSGLPRRDLLLSPQHRILVQSRIAGRMFGQTEVLVSAVRLAELPGIFVDLTLEGVEYFHLLFERHEIFYAEGTPTESFLAGPEAVRSLGPHAREEILGLFPEAAADGLPPAPARLIPAGKHQKNLVSRHLRSGRPMLGAPSGSPGAGARRRIARAGTDP